ncbi:MAG: hypothetical protein ABSA41_02635 [Terriglobia bacterium]|jgi:hypothetical protein
MNTFHKDASVVGTKSPYARRSIAKAVITLSLLVPTLLLFAAPARATTIYVSQSGGTFSGGSACNGQTAISASTFNATTLTAGDTVYLCGTITTALTNSSSGTSGSKITIQWDSGASLSVCSTTGAIQPSGSYLIFDLGRNSSAITCPNNGTGLSTSIVAMGINNRAGSLSNIEVRNGTIGPLYVRSSGDLGTGGGGSTAIYQFGGGGNHYHHLTIHDSEFAINDQIQNTISGDEIDHLTITNAAEGIWYACGTSPCTSTGAKIHDNNYTPTQLWASTSNSFHAELLHIYSNGSGTSISGVLVYNNTCQAGSGWPYSNGTMNGTACLFAEAAVSGGTTQGYMFNNLVVFNGSGHFPGDGAILIYSHGNNWGLYNNTIDCQSNTNGEGQGIEIDGGTGEVYDLRNNIIMNCNTAIMNSGSGGTYTGDRNDYYNIGGGGWMWNGNTESTLAAWKSASGIDSNASTNSPGLNSSYMISSTTSWAYSAHSGGDNLTSLGVTQLDTGAPATFGASGACGSSCTARASSGAWDLGVYPGSAVAAPNPPTNLTATPH